MNLYILCNSNYNIVSNIMSLLEYDDLSSVVFNRLLNQPQCSERIYIMKKNLAAVHLVFDELNMLL